MYKRSSISCLGDREQEMVKGLQRVVKRLNDSLKFYKAPLVLSEIKERNSF